MPDKNDKMNALDAMLAGGPPPPVADEVPLPDSDPVSEGAQLREDGTLMAGDKTIGSLSVSCPSCGASVLGQGGSEPVE